MRVHLVNWRVMAAYAEHALDPGVDDATETTEN